jgi:hypothetical protein
LPVELIDCAAQEQISQLIQNICLPLERRGIINLSNINLYFPLRQDSAYFYTTFNRTKQHLEAVLDLKIKYNKILKLRLSIKWKKDTQAT